MQWLSRLVFHHARLTLLLSLAFLIAAGAYGITADGRLSDGGIEDLSSESARQQSLTVELLGNHRQDVTVRYSHDNLAATDPTFARSVQDAVKAYPADTVHKVLDFYRTGAPQLISTDGKATLVIITLAGSNDDERFASYQKLQPFLPATGVKTDLAGTQPTFTDLTDTVDRDLLRAELIALPVVYLLSLWIFGSLTASVLPVLVGLLSVAGAMAIVRAMTMFTDVSVFASNIISLIGLGLAVDYALFMVMRFRQELAKRPGTHPDQVAEALSATMASAGRTVVVSGLVVATSLASLLVFPVAFLRGMALGGICAVLMAMLAAITTLAAVLAVLGRRIDWGALPWMKRDHGVLDAGAGRFWARLAETVMRRPVVMLAVTVPVLIGLALPMASAHWSGIDERILPPAASSRTNADAFANQFGGHTSTAQILVRGAGQEALATYTAALGKVAGVQDVSVMNAAGNATLLGVTWQGRAQDMHSQRTVTAVREVPLPQGQRWVGGSTAETIDLVACLKRHLPHLGITVALSMMVLLFLAFGSVVLPIKAVIITGTSIAASFGVMTWVFQDGHFSSWLGFKPTGYLEVSQPVLVFVIAFGLAMDYSVYLLARIQEEFHRTGDNQTAVRDGLAQSGRIITSAALLLGVVVVAFTTSEVVLMKMIGLGLFTSVILDATVVRAVVVPATMRLLGHWNWWAPAPLARWWNARLRSIIDESGAAHAQTSPAEAPVPAAVPVGMLDALPKQRDAAGQSARPAAHPDQVPQDR